VLLDDALVEAREPIGAFEVAVIEIGESAHVVESEAPFGAMQFGWTNEVHDACLPYATHGTCQTSYAHPTGMRTQRLWDP
jgi:hypothetical protein